MLAPAATQAYMASKGLPLTGLLLVATILVLIGGGLSVLLGYKSKIGALLLIGFLIPATLNFSWKFPRRRSRFFQEFRINGRTINDCCFWFRKI
jgi:putative oxidoreductase